MLEKTTGIVLHNVKYAESSSVLTVYSRLHGRSAYMIYGVGKKKSAVKPALLQALSILEMNVNHQPGKDIQQIKEVRVAPYSNGISPDPVKNALALFIAELLFKTLKRPGADEHLYDFLEHAIQMLEEMEFGLANFHLVFMFKLSKFLGFAPTSEDADKVYFDLMNGVFLKTRPLHKNFLNIDDTANFTRVLHTGFDNMHELHLSRSVRQKILNDLIEYYKLHLPEFHGLNATAVLQELFD